MNRLIHVKLWGTTVGYLAYEPSQKSYATFQYDEDFINSGIQISPIHMKYPPNIHLFDQLSELSFKGVPGIIADSLPDKYGNHLIDIYMAEKNVPSSEVTTLDRLLYVADRAMGALEYHPGEKLLLQRTSLDIDKLSKLAELVQKKHDNLRDQLDSAEDRAAALSLIRIGSSAGGARSKALIALSPKDKLVDGTVSHGDKYSYWVLKFDSRNNQDRDSSDPKGMPTVEFIYSLIAKEAGINIPQTKILKTGDEKHFMIERFDRIKRDHHIDKLHYASWAGIAHADRDMDNSYEQLILLIRQMNLGQSAISEVFRRAVFNILGRNQDDHTKNTGFLMDRSGKWTLAPAFDLTYSYDPQGLWTRNHQCWLNGKNNKFNFSDLLEFGSRCNLSNKKSKEIIFQVADSFKKFTSLADQMDLPKELKSLVESNMRLNILP